MSKIKIFMVFCILMVVYGCVSEEKIFNDGIKRLNEIDNNYNVNLKSSPDDIEGINELIAQIMGYKVVTENLPQSLDYLIDFRIKFLEAEKLHMEGWQWGRASTTEFGFGCKNGFARITESAALRNQSAQKGFESVTALAAFIDKYPEEAKNLNLTQKDVLFLNANYFQVEKKALRDAAIIKNACKKDSE